MKSTRRLLLMMLWIACWYGTGDASASQQSEASSSETREETVADRPSQGTKRLGGEKDQRGGGYRDAGLHRPARVTKSMPKPGPSAGRPKPASRDQLRFAQTQANNDVAREAHGTAIASPPPAFRSAGVPQRVINPPGLPTLGPASAALGGQRFTNARHPGASLAISGGPVHSSRRGAAINGTEMKRQP